MHSIAFMGTSEFAVPILKFLFSIPEYSLKYVYTRNPKSAGRGQKIIKTPVHVAADELKLKVLCPVSLKMESAPDVDLIFVVSYGLLLPEHFLKIPKYGCVNVHPSLLPKFRGPSPIRSVILSGEEKTGVTLMFMDIDMDAGDIIMQKVINIENDDYTSLSKKLIILTIQMLSDALPKIFSKFCPRKMQNHNLATYTKKIIKQNALIDWKDECVEIIRKIRAFSPNAFFYHNKNIIKIIKADYSFCKHNKFCGTINHINDYLNIYCKDGVIIPLKIQREGRKAMMVKDFMLGYKIN